MWVKYLKAKNLMAAQMWQDLLEGEGLPTNLVPEDGIMEWREDAAFDVMVPEGRQHVADEIIRKL